MFYTIEELVQQADRDYQGNIAELMIATETELTGRERPEILALMTRNLEVMKESEAQEAFWMSFSRISAEKDKEIQKLKHQISEMKNTKAWKLYRSIKKK